ncbi:SusC/RagA family TonB-linked outer membrane protein [Fulvivirgaceae bacterium QH1ED-6-2]|nr:SusC/RagA family TonB-linked outer membrane protein [Parachryseolinea silvisoli]
MKNLRYGQACAWSVLNKITVVMKIWLLLMIPIGVAVASNAHSQNLSLELNNVTLREAFRAIEKESEYSFFFNDAFTDLNKRVSVTAKNEPLASVLSRLLAPTSLTYKMLDEKLIVIAPRNAPPVVVRGRVTGASDSQPLPGVNVTVKGSGKGTITNANGEYTLEVESGSILVFTFIGYSPVEILIQSQTTVDVPMKEDIATLSEVTVVSTGYQEVDKRLFTGSVVSLDAKDIKTEGTVDVSRMLQGRAAGVSVQNVSGTFGAAPKIRIRGATSITGDNKPLWVIDGVVLEDVVNVSAEQLTTGDPSTLIGSSVAGLNADDIEKITILKDASATALYGARAKDGVIVISTKKGRVGKPLITYTGNFSSYLKPSYNSYNILNSVDQMSVYTEMERKGLLNHADVSNLRDGGIYTKMYDLINGTYDGEDGFQLDNTDAARRAYLNRYALANTDWFDELFDNSFVQEHSLGVSSGTESSQLYFSTSYYNDNGWSIADNVKRYTANARGNFRVSDKVSFGIIATGSVRDQRAPGSVTRQANVVEGGYDRDFDINPFSYAINTSRVLTAYNEDGSREYFTRNYAPFNILNEVDKNYIDLDQLDFKLQGEFNYQILKGLKYDFVGSARSVNTVTEHKVEEGSNMAEAYRANGTQLIRQGNKFLYWNPEYPNVDPVVVLPQGGFYNRTDDKMISYYLKNQLTWNHTFGIHNANLVVGQELRQVDRRTSFNNGFGYQYSRGGVPYTDYLILKQMLEANFNYFGMGYGYERYASFYGGATYSYNSKYVLNATVRMDGSNRLGESSTARWLPTWNVSAAWNVDTEKFMQNLRAIDFLTVKAGYGLTANTGNANNATVVFRSGTTRRPYLTDTESLIGIESLKNSDLTWEKQYELNVGVNVGFLNTFVLAADVYKRNQFDLISIIKTSGIGGEPYKAINYADMKSHGVDLTLGATLLNRGDWGWNANYVFSYNKTEITSLKNEPRIFNLVFPDGGAMNGYPVRGLFSVDFQGLDPESGMPRFIDHEGNLSSDVFLQDPNVQYLKYEGAIDPTVTGGVSNTFRYKAFTLNVFLTYQAGNKIRLNPVFKTAYSDLDAMPREFLDRWVLPGDERFTNIPSILDRTSLANLTAGYPYNSYNYSTARVADGGFIRMRTVSLAYNLPAKLLSTTGLKAASLTVTGTNLLLLYADKRLYGQDPEFYSSGGVAMPVPKQITATLKLNL